MNTYNWELPKLQKKDLIQDGDIRLVNLPVKCLFTWSDKIIDEVDEQGNVLSYTEGFIMSVLPQDIVFNEQDTTFLAQTIRNESATTANNT